MRFFFLILTSCIYYAKIFTYAQEDLLDFDSTDDDLFSGGATYHKNDFWDSASPLTSADPDDNNLSDLFLIDSSSACTSSLSSRPLGRRAGGQTCTNQQQTATDEKKRPFFEIRPLGTTKDAPLFPLQEKFEICSLQGVGYRRQLIFCDSGSDTDRHPTSIPQVFDIINATPCNIPTDPFFFQKKKEKQLGFVLIHLQLTFSGAVGNHIGYGAARRRIFI